MVIQDLKYFICTVETQNITKAAETLFISQQALSKAISRLESELGVSLFIRSRNGVTLTEYGKKFIPYALSSVAQYNHVTSSLKSMNSVEKDTINFGYGTGMMSHFLPGFLIRFIESHPDAVFNINSYSDDPYHRVSSIPECTINLGSTHPGGTVYKIEYECHYPLKIMLSKDNPLSSKRSITWEDLLTVPFIILNIDTDFIRTLSVKLAAHGIEPRYKLNASEHELIQYLIKYQNAVVPYGGAEQLIPPENVVLNLEGMDMSMDFYLCTVPSHVYNKTEKELLNSLISEFKLQSSFLYGSTDI